MVNSVTKSWSRTASLLPSAMYWARGPRGTSGPLVFSFGPVLKIFKIYFYFQLGWVFIAVLRLSVVAASVDYSAVAV